MRAVIAAAIGPIPYGPGSDPYGYASIAVNIRTGNGILADAGIGMFRALYPPLYSFLILLADPSVVNTVIDVGTALTIFIIGAELESPGAGKVGAALYLLWPVAVLEVTTAQKDGLAILLATQIGLAALRLGRDWDWREAIRLGVCAGLMGLTQPAFVSFAGIAALVMARRRALRIAVWSIPVAVLILLPWWIRNWAVFHAFVPFTTAFGFNLVVAVTGYYTPFHQFAKMPELEGTRAAAAAALHVWAERPGHVLYLRTAAAVKSAIFEQAFPAMLYLVPSMEKLRATVAPTLQLYWLAMVGLGLAGLRRAPRELLALVAACLLQFALFNFWFEFGERHRYLIVPFVMLLAAGVVKGEKPIQK